MRFLGKPPGVKGLKRPMIKNSFVKLKINAAFMSSCNLKKPGCKEFKGSSQHQQQNNDLFAFKTIERVFSVFCSLKSVLYARGHLIILDMLESYA